MNNRLGISVWSLLLTGKSDKPVSTTDFSGTGKKPNNQTEYWQEKDDHQPDQFGDTGGSALDDIDNGPNVENENDQSKKKFH